jgi:hypothetical protein
MTQRWAECFWRSLFFTRRSLTEYCWAGTRRPTNESMPAKNGVARSMSCGECYIIPAMN